jgi:hypothetical protein
MAPFSLTMLLGKLDLNADLPSILFIALGVLLVWHGARRLQKGEGPSLSSRERNVLGWPLSPLGEIVGGLAAIVSSIVLLVL